MKTRKKAVTTVFLTILLMSLAFPILIQPTLAQPTPATFTDLDGWKKFETDIITIMFPADGRHPMFLWWYKKQNDTVYAVHYKGLIEYYLIRKGAHFTRMSASEVTRLVEAFFKEYHEALQRKSTGLSKMESRYMGINGTCINLSKIISQIAKENIDEALEFIKEMKEQASKIAEEAETLGEEDLSAKAQEVMDKLDGLEEKLDELDKAHSSKLSKIKREIQDAFKNIRELVKTHIQLVRSRINQNIEKRRQVIIVLNALRMRLHPPFFPFFNGRWELIPPEEFNASDGTTIGVSFGFNLTHVRNPWWKFAEGNVLIKCRFYYVPVSESVDSISYTVEKAEMKMDFVISHWEWNIDVIIDLIEHLKEEFGIDLPLPDVKRAGLALWLDLTSLNTSRIDDLQEMGNTVEKIGNATSMKNSLSKIIDTSTELVKTMENGYEEFAEVYEGVQEEMADHYLDWPDLHEKVQDLIEDSVDDVVEELSEIRLMIDEALSVVEDVVDYETYADIEECVSEVLSSVNGAVDRLNAINETLMGLLSVEDVSTFNETLTTTLKDYEEALEAFGRFTSEKLDKLRHMLHSMGEEIAKDARATRMRIEDRIVNIKEDKSDENEKPIDMNIKLGELLKIGFATENSTLAGWFQFVNATRLTYPNGTETTASVKAAYLEAGAYMRFYMLYQYFNNATLEHDPSIGLAVPETSTPEAKTPQYAVKGPTGSQMTPQEVLRIILPLVTPELILILVGTASIIALVISIAKWKRRVINVVGVS